LISSNHSWLRYRGTGLVYLIGHGTVVSGQARPLPSALVEQGGSGRPGPAPDPAWERRHADGSEWWSFDFFTAEARLGGFVGLVFHAAPRVAWFWAALVGDGRPYLLVRDLGVAVPRSATSRQIRSDGLWADVNCETPHQHWSLAVEAFGVGLDDPDEALGLERGVRLGLGLDLEWEAAAEVVGGEGAYDQACTVHGEVLVGAGRGVETIGLDGHGWRRHGWGGFDWFDAPRSRLAGRLDDGSPYRSDAVGAVGVRTSHRAPVLLEAGGRRAVLERRLCRFTAPDGRPGCGWAEWLAPAPVRPGTR